MRSETAREKLPDTRGAVPRSWFLAALFLVACCAPGSAQTVQFLPEVDTYFDLRSGTRIWFQAKETREGRVPVQAQFGPSVEFYIKSLPALTPKAVVDPDKSESRLLVLSLGYRYLPQSNEAAATNRMVPLATFQVPLKGGFSLSDRNRADLDWQAGDFTWRYRNRLQIERGFPFAGRRVTPYVNAEVYYQSNYSKWSETDLSVGVRLPLKTIFAFNAYYQHQNNTGRAPNQQVNAIGGILNLYFSMH